MTSPDQGEKYCLFCISELKRRGQRVGRIVTLSLTEDCQSTIHNRLPATLATMRRRVHQPPRGPDGRFLHSDD